MMWACLIELGALRSFGNYAIDCSLIVSEATSCQIFSKVQVLFGGDKPGFRGGGTSQSFE